MNFLMGKIGGLIAVPKAWTLKNDPGDDEKEVPQAMIRQRGPVLHERRAERGAKGKRIFPGTWRIKKIPSSL